MKIEFEVFLASEFLLVDDNNAEDQNKNENSNVRFMLIKFEN
jgi:hypothetical protein